MLEIKTSLSHQYALIIMVYLHLNSLQKKIGNLSHQSLNFSHTYSVKTATKTLIDHSKLSIVLLVGYLKNCCTTCKTSFFLICIYAYSSSLTIFVINVIQIILNLWPKPAYIHMTVTNFKAFGYFGHCIL